MSRDRQLLLGMFVLVVFMILAVYTLAFSDFSLFKDQYLRTVFFPDAHGLRRGDSVLVAGLRQGKVREITYDAGAAHEKRITVVLVLDQEVELRDGFEIYIEDSTVLGGKNVYVDPGPAGAGAIDASAPLFGRVKGGALDSLGKLVDDNGAKVNAIVDDIQAVVADVKAGKGAIGVLVSDEAVAQQVKDGVASIKASAANIEAISSDIQAGKGVLGRLAKDDDLAVKFGEIGTNLAKITDDFTAISADIRDGKGVLGSLVKDEVLRNDVSQAVATIRTIAERINNSDGTFWRLFEDSQLVKDIEAFTANLNSGTLGKLFTSDEIYVKLDQIADDIAAATDALRNAQGTLGMLVMDKGLYDEVAKALRVLTRSLEEYREAAPVTTFTSVLFGAF